MSTTSLRSSSTSFAVWLLVLGVAVAAPAGAQDGPARTESGITVGRSVHNDVSPPLREIPEIPVMLQPQHLMFEPGELPRKIRSEYDPVVQDFLAPEAMPATILNFNGIPFPGVSCSCAPPDTNGEVGATQYVQMVNEGLQVFDKGTGSSVLGPIGISTLWSGFGGVCETSGAGDPVVLYDQLADRWVVTQFAGGSIPTDECVAVSTTDDATGTWFRYDFHLGSNFFDYPKLGVWPDAYYMSMNVFNAAGTSFLGPQPFALDRAAMLTGAAATFITPGLQSTSLGSLITADLDGSNLPPAGAPIPWLSLDSTPWKIYRFHVDWAVPGNSTFALGGNLTPAGYSTLSAGVPQAGTTSLLDNLADRPMFRLAYRRFGDGHEALVGNFTVSSGGVAGIRWWEITNATSGTPGFVQQGTYQPDSTWRWMGSAAMDTLGDLVVGFSASSSSINPQIRYAGRLAGDPAGTLAQGEATLFSGTGSQTGTGGRWGDYSDLTLDPVDDCTFWYTTEYYSTTSSYNWRTRIGNFKFPGCSLSGTFSLAASPASQAVCAPDDALYTVDVGSVSGFTNPVTLGVTGNPASTTVDFTPNPVTPPGSSLFTVGDTSTAAEGTYALTISGSASGSPDHSTGVELSIFDAAPAAATLTAPADGATDVALRPAFSWTAAAGAAGYLLEVDDNADFSSPVYSATVVGTTHTPSLDLPSGTLLYWRVTADNACGSTVSGTFQFTTVALPGDCPPGVTADVSYSEDFETGAPGWSHSGTGDTWALSGANPNSGVQSFFAVDPATVSDQRLVSPPIALPAGQDPVVLEFWNWQHMETRTGGCYDGGILEVSTDGGANWTQVPGADLLTDPYDGPVSTCCSNPLAGLDAWCGNNPQPYLGSRVDVSAWAGQTVQFRFRLGSDTSANRPGWYVDDVSVWSCPQLFTLSVSVVGSGGVTSSPAGIACPGDCTQDYDGGTVVSLTPTPAGGWQFTGWSGDCSGNGACDVTMDQARSVTATFTQLFTLSASVAGSGSVTSVPAGIDCPGDCSEDYLSGTSVALTATPSSGWQFTGWSGDCTGSGACNVTMDQARSVTATFTQVFTLTVSVTGSGSVTSAPAGIDCPGDCSEGYLSGTSVALTATPAAGWRLIAWSGDCTGSGACSVTMDQARSVAASFDTMPFIDGFESGDTSAWSATVP